MDLVLNQDAFERAKSDFKNKCEELKTLRANLQASFETLKTDWDTEAGRLFFDQFENKLLKHLDEYSKVFEHLSDNLSTASEKYEEVFRIADTVAKTEY